MEQKINIAEMLRDCTKGMELYSPIFGTVYFEGVRDTGRAIMIDVTTSCNTRVQFYSDGKFNTYYSESEVTLFPSKSQRDWSKFQRPFKDGDILYVKAAFDWICIYKESEDTENVYKYVAVLRQPNATGIVKDTNCLCCRGDISEIRIASEEEKQKLFDAIQANGYRWNDKTKTLEKLVSDRFNINTLVPFKSKVLVRDSQSTKWLPAIWGFYNEDSCDYHYEVVGGNSFSYCIPYEGNEHLRGTTNDCDDYYKDWE